MEKTTTNSIQLPQPTWRRHFEPLLFLIHCANVIWISRVFMINYENMRGNYFLDIYFVFGFVCALVLHQVRWWIYLNKLEDKKYEFSFDLVNDIDAMSRYIFGGIPYLIKTVPNSEVLERAVENYRKNCVFFIKKTNFDLFRIIGKSKKIIASHAFFIVVAFFVLFKKLQPEGIKIFLYGDWRMYSLFHTLAIGILIYSILFFLNSIIKGE